jgi:hypothetical protein
MNTIAHLITKSSPERGGGSHRLTEGPQLSAALSCSEVGAPPSLRATSPFQGGFSL